MPRILRLGALMLAAAACAACGNDFTFQVKPPAGEAAPLAAVYDVLASWPSLDFPEFSAVGLTLDMTIEIEPGSLGAGGGPIRGTVTIQKAEVAGVARPFSPKSAIDFSGTLSGDAIAIRFGDLFVGMSRLSPDLDGIVDATGRTMDGVARFSNITETGTWTGVKQRRYLIASSAFGLQGTASVVTVRYATQFSVSRDVELVSGDPVAAGGAELPLIVNRLFFDNIQVLDAASSFLTAVQFSTGNASNPHDALLAGAGRLYVTRYEPPFDDVLVADPANGDKLGTIPLSAYATNATGTPRPDRLLAAAGKVMVTLQNIDATFQEYGPGLLAFLDPGDDTVIDTITLAGRNPFGPMSVDPATGDVYVADAGIFQGLLPGELSGGVEVIDPVSMTSKGILVDDDDLGGNVSGVAATELGRGYAVVVTPGGANDVKAFDPASGAVLGTVLSTTALIPEIRYDGDGYLLVAEHDIGNPGLRVLDAATGAPVARISLSLPPASIAILTRGVLSGP